MSLDNILSEAKMEKLNRRIKGQAPMQMLQIPVKSKKDKGDLIN